MLDSPSMLNQARGARIEPQSRAELQRRGSLSVRVKTPAAAFANHLSARALLNSRVAGQ